jgi:hypothetical protein
MDWPTVPLHTGHGDKVLRLTVTLKLWFRIWGINHLYCEPWRWSHNAMLKRKRHSDVDRWGSWASRTWRWSCGDSHTNKNK